MTERKHVEQWLEKAGETMGQVEQVFEDSQRVHEGDPMEYVEAQSQLEEVSGELDSLLRAATPAQRDQLNRTQQRLRQLQNQMILRQ